MKEKFYVSSNPRVFQNGFVDAIFFILSTSSPFKHFMFIRLFVFVCVVMNILFIILPPVKKFKIVLLSVLYGKISPWRFVFPASPSTFEWGNLAWFSNVIIHYSFIHSCLSYQLINFFFSSCPHLSFLMFCMHFFTQHLLTYCFLVKKWSSMTYDLVKCPPNEHKITSRVNLNSFLCK